MLAVITGALIGGWAISAQDKYTLKVPNGADFMVKDSKRFADSGGWGWAEFEYDAASDTFRPGTLADKPPQSNNAKCGFACHTMVKTRDYVFTDYGHR
jgi:Cytochrome P460